MNTQIKNKPREFIADCPDCIREKKLRSMFRGAKEVLLHNSSPESINAVLKVLRGQFDDILESSHTENNHE